MRPWRVPPEPYLALVWLLAGATCASIAWAATKPLSYTGSDGGSLAGPMTAIACEAVLAIACGARALVLFVRALRRGVAGAREHALCLGVVLVAWFLGNFAILYSLDGSFTRYGGTTPWCHERPPFQVYEPVVRATGMLGWYGGSPFYVVAYDEACARAGQLRREPEVRAIWVTRYDYRTESDVRRIVERCASLGTNRILFQVRGNADAFYRSTLEPRSPRLEGDFDPLAVALEEAERFGIAVEAWINVMPLWKGRTPPADPAHPYHTHPEWLVVGSDGRPQALNDHYVSANPARDDVRAHVARVAGEIAANYAVAGIHLDYIRYVTDLEGALDFSYDEASLSLFGRDPRAEPEAWARFKEDQVTETVAAIREAVRAARPSCELTAAVFPTAEGRDRVFQDAERWVRDRLLDRVYAMAYDEDDARHAERVRECRELLGSRVHVGIGVHRHLDPATTRRQIEAARAHGGGFSLFCYAAFFPSADDAELATGDLSLRERRVEAVRALLVSSEER